MRKWLLVAALMGHVALALWPFRLTFPRPIWNSARMSGDHTIVFDGRSLVLAPDLGSWLPEAIATNRLQVSLRARTDFSHQTGPARLLTISESIDRRNLTIGQENADLVVRLRRPGSDLNGMPSYRIPFVFDDVQIHEIDVRIEPGIVVITVDGVVRRWPLPLAPLQGWDPQHSLAVGNEVTGTRPWQGLLSDVRIQTAFDRIDVLSDAGLHQPSVWWLVPDHVRDFLRDPLRTPSESDVGVALLHLVGFLPVGYMLPSALRHRLRPVTAVLALALGVEILKFAAVGRHLSLLNFGFRALGGLIGARTAKAAP